jgi:hypothetical protein
MRPNKGPCPFLYFPSLLYPNPHCQFQTDRSPDPGLGHSPPVNASGRFALRAGESEAAALRSER